MEFPIGTPAGGSRCRTTWFVIGTGVVIRRIEGEEKTKGGIIIPDNAKEKPQEGEVIAAGPGARDENFRHTPGFGREEITG
jgi:hypothetical protein